MLEEERRRRGKLEEELKTSEGVKDNQERIRSAGEKQKKEILEKDEELLKLRSDLSKNIKESSSTKENLNQ